MPRSASFLIAAIAWSAACAQTPLDAVRAWYAVAREGADQRNLTAFGTVGGGPQPLSDAYARLAPSLRQKMSEAQFFDHFHGLAQLRLLQARAVHMAPGAQSARVFVEEERTVVLAGVPAVAWYAGFLELRRSPEWRVASLDGVTPEDIISLTLGGHSPWRNDAIEVARVQLRCDPNTDACRNPRLHKGPDADAVTVSIDADGSTEEIDLARLHSGVWTEVDRRSARRPLGTPKQ